VNRFLCSLLAVGLLVAAGCSSDTATTTTGNTTARSSANNPVVVMDTSMGTIKIELFQDRAPGTVKNFLGYVDDKFYDGTIFHRVIPTFMIQGGGFVPGMTQKPTKATIKNESDNGLANYRGTLAMARTPDPHSASSQFFINTVDNAFLDKARAQDRYGYCVFGKVLEGMDVVDKIKDVPTGNRSGQNDVPLNDVVIQAVRRAQ
jgi:cyclophilin family peptidyl-prolyl cis-trans isomerase